MWPEKVMAATLSYFCELVEGEENKIGYIFHMDCNVWKQHHFPAASLQTWATPEKQFTSTRSSNEEETNWPLQEVFTLQGERHCTYYQQQGGELYR